MAGEQRMYEGILYPENMRPDWRTCIEDTLQLPFAYCIHDKDLQNDEKEQRKIHVHCILVFPNTTTKKKAITVLNKLSLPGKTCCSTAEAVISIRKAYDYLIHDTDECREKKKHLYSEEERIIGNNFDIGQLVQLSTAEKQAMKMEIRQLVYDESLHNFIDLDFLVGERLGSQYLEILSQYSNYFFKLVNGMWKKKDEYRQCIDDKEKDEKNT